MNPAVAAANKEVTMRTLERFGYSNEDIKAVLKDHTGTLNLEQARKMLEEHKKKKLSYDFPDSHNMQTYFNRMYKPSKPSSTTCKPSSSGKEVVANMIIVSSDSESDDCIVNISSDSDNDLPKGNKMPNENVNALRTIEPNEKAFQKSRNHTPTFDASQCALSDMPNDATLKCWFENTYEIKEDGIAMKEDMINEFCKEFKLPSYTELQDLFFHKVEELLSCGEYRTIECIESACYDGLQKIDKDTTGTVTEKIQALFQPNKNLKKDIPLNRPTDPSKVNEKPVEVKPVLVKKDKLPSMAAQFHKKSNNNDELSSSSMTSQIQELFGSPTSKSKKDQSQLAAATSSSNLLQTHDILVTTSTSNFSSMSSSQNNFFPPKPHHTDTVSKDHKSKPEISCVTVSFSTNATSGASMFSESHPRVNTTVSSSLHGGIDHFITESRHVTEQKNKSNVLHYNAPVSTALQMPTDRAMYSEKRNVNQISNQELLQLLPTPGNPSLRPIVIDGSNIACSHGSGHNSTYSCRGIALCVHYFWQRGHRDVTCFVPNFRKGRNGHPPTTGHEILFELEKRNICKFTPSRRVDGRNLVCYDDRFIIQLAEQNEGIVVSNDQFRDLMQENHNWKQVIVNRLLQYVFVQDIFMPASDPLGRNGPNLDEFLQFPVSRRQKQAPALSYGRTVYTQHSSTYSETEKQLRELFPEKKDEIDKVLKENRYINDMNVLANKLFEDIQ